MKVIKPLVPTNYYTGASTVLIGWMLPIALACCARTAESEST
jgi:hypothetical protein